MSATNDQARDEFYRTVPSARRVVYDHVLDHYVELDRGSPEFHYGVRAALRASTDDDVVRRLIDALASSARTVQDVMEQIVRITEAAPPSPILFLSEPRTEDET